MTIMSRRYTKLLQGMALVPLLASSMALAQTSADTDEADADEALDFGDSAEYFFAQSSAVSPHPSRSGIGDHGRKSPFELWKGDNDSFLRATFQAQLLWAGQGSSWFGESEANLGERSNNWWETGIIGGLTGSLFSDEGDELYSKVNFVATSTQNIDGAGSNVDYGDTNRILMEDAYIGWRSGNRWSNLGKNFLDVSFGRQQYVAGNGFLFFAQSSNGGKRGGYWLGIRKAADLAGIVQVNYKDLAVDLVYLKADDQSSSDDPNNNTKVGGITLDYSLGDFGGIGGGYYSVDAEEEPRDGMNIWDVRFSITPFKQYAPGSWAEQLTFEGEYVGQNNGDAIDASGWYLSAKYDFSNVGWTPSLTYRYSSFDGDNPNTDKNENYDPLFYGFYDWGYWFQGEVLGEYVLSNSNLKSNMVRLGLDPTESVHMNVFYYNFKLDQPESFGVESSSFANEWNVTVDWTVNDYLMFSAVGAYVDPKDGAKEYTGGDDNWTYLMLWASLTFK